MTFPTEGERLSELPSLPGHVTGHVTGAGPARQLQESIEENH